MQRRRIGVVQVGHVRAGQFHKRGSKMTGQPLGGFVPPVAGGRAVSVVRAGGDSAWQLHRGELAGRALLH